MRKIKRLFCLFLALCITLNVPMPLQTNYVRAEEGENVIYEDGIIDNWEQDASTIKGGEACEITDDGWLHLKAGTSNGNNPSQTAPPAIFISDKAYDLSKEGFFETTIKTIQAGKYNRIGFYLGYKDQNTGMFFGYNASGWYWQKYGAEGSPWSANIGAVPGENSEIKVRIEWTADKKATLKVDGTELFTDVDFSGITGLGDKIGIKAGTFNAVSGTEISDIYLKDIHYTDQAEAATYTVTGRVLDEQNNPVSDAIVTLFGKEATTNASGEYEFRKVIAGTHEITIEKIGYNYYNQTIVVLNEDTTLLDIQLEPGETFDTININSEDMEVTIAKDFPSVVQYVMKKYDNKVFYGQASRINTITINGKDIILEKESVEAVFEDNKAVYVMTVKDTVGNIDAKITAELVVDKNTLAFNITKVENNLDNQQYPVQTIYIPNHSLVSVRTTQNGTNLKGAKMSTKTTLSGDSSIVLNKDTAVGKTDYMYAFISNDELSAGLWSNSENDGSAVYTGVNGGSLNTRVEAVISNEGGFKSMGLGSCKWYYNRKITAKGKDYVMPQTEMPMTTVVITGDLNQDQQIDWQDGAIAYRDIMNNPYKSEEVPELVAWRIAMNFSGQAQNPFLTTLDNVKRVAMHTDGLGQSVLLKGYGNEGHDSGHPDYADIGNRIGGADDMNTMMTAGKEYSARFGIHVNAGEMYPESKAFNDDLVRRKADGSLRYGWNWLDQAVGIDALYDLGEGLRQQRFNELKEKVGDNMDFVYVDIWGNLTGSPEDAWETRKLTDMITGNGWRMATEWSAANEYDSTFQHWAADLTYGGYAMKGINSEVMRFLRNHQKDSWVGDFPRYGGSANAPLLGGYNMKDFEGWQGRNDYDAYITNLYEQDLTTKFFQHYKVMKWVNGTPVNYGAHGDVPAHTWTPEMEITLQDADKDTVVITRGSNDVTSPLFRDRTVTLNGKVVLQGTMTKGDGTGKGTESYLLPWYWNAQTGEKVAAADEKLYHFNTQGGTTTWELPKGWESLSTVYAYELTDLGKTNKTEINVVDGKIQLTAKAGTPYVLYKGEKANLAIEWSTGMHIKDAGFNSGINGLNTYWTKEGTGSAAISKSQYSNPMLKLSGDITMSQTLTDLVPGQNYAVYVGVDNRSDSKAGIILEEDGKEIASNYTDKSIAKNYVLAYTHSNVSATVDGSSYFQNMYVFFKASNKEVTLKLKREAGSDDTYFDDIRIVKNDSENIIKDENGKIIKFQQDFETVAQGIYPFVIGPVEGVADNRTHLSELHAPYTQNGWDVKRMDDVLEGNWSVKSNGLCTRDTLVYQTIPQNFKFEEGQRYKVSFDYQLGFDNGYKFAVGNGEYDKENTVLYKMEAAWGTTAHKEFEIIGDASGKTWIGIYSTISSPDVSKYTYDEANFNGVKDFVIDNLVIEKVNGEVTKGEIKALIESCTEFEAGDYQPKSFKAFKSALVNAQVVFDRANATQAEITSAYSKLMLAKAGLVEIGSVAESDEYDIIATPDNVLVGSAQELVDDTEGPKELAIDNDTSTYWHSEWANEDSSLLWFEFSYPERVDVAGLRYLPRPGADNANGKLLDYTIMVSNDNGETWGYTQDGTFAPQTKWQMVSFPGVIKDVTNVRLFARSTAGQSKADENIFSSAAELRLIGTVKKVENNEDDKEKLEVLINTLSKLVQSDYTKKEWDIFANELQIANAVLENASSTQYDYVYAYQELNYASKKLLLRADISNLSKLVAECEKLVKSNYISNTWAVFSNSLKAAKAVLEDADATQLEVDNALSGLTIAKNGLVKVAPYTPVNPVEPTKDGTDTNTNPNNKVVVNVEAKDNKVTISSDKMLAAIDSTDVGKVEAIIVIPSDAVLKSIILPKDVLKKASEEKINLFVNLTDEDEKVVARWYFDASTLAKASLMEDVNLAVNISNVSNSKQSKVVKQLIRNKQEGTVVSLEQKGKLPAQANLTFKVANGKIGDRVYIYKLNSNTKKLESIVGGYTHAINKEGYVTMGVLEGGDYVVLTKKADSKNITAMKDQIVVKANKTTIKLSETMSIQVILPTCLQKTSKITSKTKSNAIGAVTVTYKVSNSKIATVDSQGKVTAKGKGTVTITTIVKMQNGTSKTVSSKITIK